MPPSPRTEVTTAAGMQTSLNTNSAADNMPNTGKDAIPSGIELSIDDITAGEETAPRQRVTDNDERADPYIDAKAEYDKTHPEKADKVSKEGSEETRGGEDNENPATDVTKASPRDYSSFATEDIEILKKMPNHIFNAVKDRFGAVRGVYEENLSLKERIAQIESGAIPESYLQHPQAYTLDKTYSQESSKLEQANFEYGLIETALDAIEAGEPYKVLRDYDKQGNPIYATVEPKRDADGNPLLDPRARNQLILNAQQLDRVREGVQQKIDGLRSNFAQNRAQVVGQFQQYQDTVFPVYAKPEFAEKVKQTISTLPSYLRADPAVASFVAKGGMLVAALQAKLKELTAEVSKTKIIQEDSRAAGPTPSQLHRAGGATKAEVGKILSASDWD